MQYTKDQESIYSNLRERFEASEHSSDNSKLSTFRAAALAAFERVQLPGAKNEAYKYTPITKKLSKNFAFNEGRQESGLGKEDLGEHIVPNLVGNVLVFVNGLYSAELSTIISPEDQCTIKGLEDLYETTSSEGIITTENELSGFGSDPFLMLNAAMADSGVYVHVPAGKIVDQPFLIYHITDSTKGNTLQHSRNVFIFEKGSQANIVEYYSGRGEHASFTNTSTEILVKENAIVTLHKIQDEANQSVHVDNTHVRQAKHSVFSAFTISLNGDMLRNNLSISLDDEHIEANMYGLTLLDNKQHVDHHTIVDHRKPNCVSNELYKCILDDQSVGVFNGKIYVRPNAQKTNAFQSNKNILLSDDATINTKPQLEIWADDVKCSHGATTGQLDEEQLFYLRARGLGKETAKKMLLYAFALDVLEKVKLPALKEFIDSKLSNRLQN